MPRLLPLIFALIPALLAQPPQPGATASRRPGNTAATPRVPVSLEDLGAIEGLVQNALTGETLRKATVQVRRADGQGRGASFSATTDAAGHYLVTDLEPGNYRVSAQRNGYVESEYGARTARRQGTVVTVGKAQRVKDIHVKLTPHGVIAGRVRDEDGEPVANATIQLLRWSYQQGRKMLSQSSSARTNDLGEYRAFGIAPGRYVLSAASGRGFDPAEGMGFGPQGPQLPARPLKESEETYVPVYYPNTFDAKNAATLELGAGSTLEGMDLTLRKVRTVRVRGSVQRPTTSAGATENERGRRGFGMVQLVPRGGIALGNNMRFGMVDAEGRFEIRGVPPGSYFLMAGGGGPGGGGEDRFSMRMPLEVGGSSLDGVVLASIPTQPLTGAFQFDGESPTAKPNLTLTLLPLEFSAQFGGPPTIRPKDDLTFEAKNITGDQYRVQVSNLPSGYYVKSIRYNQTETADATVLVPATGGGNLIVTLSSKGGSLEGSVVSETGQPAASSTIILWAKDKPERFDLTRTGTSNAQGQYSFTGLAPGEYRLAAVELPEPGLETDPAFLKRLEPLAETVIVKELSRESKPLKEVRTP